MEVIYFWCDGEVGACDDEDRKRLIGLAQHDPNADNGKKTPARF